MIIVDTDPLIGLFEPKDALHDRVISIFTKLLEENIDICILPTTLGEFVTLATIRIGREQTQKALKKIQEFDFLIQDISEDMAGDAIDLYLQQTHARLV